MLSFAPTLGINSHRLGRQESLITSSRLSLNRMSILPAIGLMRSAPLALNQPLVRTSKLLSTRIDRSHIGWDTWNPLDYPYDSSLDIESFNEGIDRSESGSDRIDLEALLTYDLQLSTFVNLDNNAPDFFTKILTNESIADVEPEKLTNEDLPIALKQSRSKSKSPAKSKPEKVPTKAKSKTSKLPAKAKPSELLPATIDSLNERLRQRIQPAIIPDPPVVNILATNDPIEPTNLESVPDIVTTFIDRSTDNIDPESSIESFVVDGASPLENREQTSPPSDNLEIVDALAESPLPKRIDLTPESRLLPDNLSPTLPTPPQLERVQKSTPNIDTNPEVIAPTDPDPRLLDPVRLPAVDAPDVSALTSPPSIQPAPAFPTTEPEITTTISESPLPFPDPLSPPPANDITATAANESGIDKTIAPASSPQLLPDTYSTTLSPAPVDADETVANTEPEVDKTIVLESPAIVTDIFPATSPLAQVEPNSSRSNEPEIATKTTEATTPIIPESLPTPMLPSPTTVNDDANIPAASDTILSDIFAATSTPPPSVESNSIPLNEIEREPTSTPEFTTLFSSDSFPTFLSPFPEVPTELTPADNNEPGIDNPTIQPNPDAISPDILPNIDTQILPVDPNSTIANEPASVTTTPEFAAQLLPENLPTIALESADPDVEITSIERDRTSIDRAIIPEFPEAVITDIATPISPVEPNSIATSNLEITSTTSPETSQFSPQLNSPLILPVETPLPADNIDIYRVTMPTSIDDNLSIDPTAPADIITPAVNNEVTNLATNRNLETLPDNIQLDRDVSNEPIELNLGSNETVDFTNLVANRNLETLPDNIQLDRNLSVNAIDLNIDRQLNLDEPILPDNNLIEPALNIEIETDAEPPIPVRGYATGGYVKAADRAKEESIAPSDTVAAMLTPGEFVINAKDAQKNLNLLTHLNSGGEAETIARSLVPELSTESYLAASATPLTKPTASIYQRQHHESLISPSLQPDLDRHQISFLNRSPLDNSETNHIDFDRSASNYLSPSLIFRKPQSSNRSDFSRFEPPDTWNSIEELMNGGSYGAEPFSFSSDGSQNFNEDRSSASSSPPNLSPKYASPVMGFANGGEVPLPDIAPKIKPITHTIEAAVPDEGGAKNSDSADLETLAREIYYRLRQRLEIERERQGLYSGNLPW
jgi:hypothetical protein